MWFCAKTYITSLFAGRLGGVDIAVAEESRLDASEFRIKQIITKTHKLYFNGK